MTSISGADMLPMPASGRPVQCSFVKKKGNMPFKCPICSNTFPDWRSLRGHKLKHKSDTIKNTYNKRHGLHVVGPIHNDSDPGGSNIALTNNHLDEELASRGIIVDDEDIESFIDGISQEVLTSTNDFSPYTATDFNNE